MVRRGPFVPEWSGKSYPSKRRSYPCLVTKKLTCSLLYQPNLNPWVLRVENYVQSMILFVLRALTLTLSDSCVTVTAIGVHLPCVLVVRSVCARAEWRRPLWGDDRRREDGKERVVCRLWTGTIYTYSSSR